MTEIDVEWFKRCYSAGFVKGRMLEVGAARIQGKPNLCDIANDLGIKDTVGADLERFDGVQIEADFGVTKDEFNARWKAGTFTTVCVFNVLEHTFDPITVLSNALSCVEPGGTMLVVTPSIWPIHNYPGDYNRLLPDWYVSFSKVHNVKLVQNEFCWLSEFGIQTIGSALEITFPGFLTRTNDIPKLRYWRSRIAHKLLNTYGRSHWGTHSAIAAAFINVPGQS